MTSDSNTPDPSVETCVVLCLKSPERSKRRLSEQIGGLATTAARHLWACAREDLRNWPGAVCYAPADSGDADWLRDELDGGETVVLQKGKNLGERISHVDLTLRAGGVTNTLYIGTDCPGMDASYLRRAASALRTHDVVLGPATDGGVVLMGARTAWPPLDELAWSTDSLRGELASLCEEHGLDVEHLEPRADVDSITALLAARAELVDDSRPARRALHQWLMQPNPAWD